MRLLIAGWQGQIGSALVSLVPRRADVKSFAVGRPARDLCEQPTLHRAMSNAAPDVVISAAAYTDVDAAETDEAEAWALNCDGPRMLAELAAERDIPIIHLSSDYVFDGLGERAFREDDSPSPGTVYGASKLAGEQAVAAVAPKHAILRTSWVFSASGSRFVSAIVERARAGEPIEAVNDRVGSPTYAPHLAAAIIDLAGRLTAPEPKPGSGGETQGASAAFGTFHAAGSGTATWFDMAQAFCGALADAEKASAAPPVVRPVASAPTSMGAVRPVNARLDCARLAEMHGISLPRWQEGVRDCVAELMRTCASPSAAE
ncbi:MAG: dTDP-4-dehydrorhamnose reductase [Pseudomonadota bacterium]